MRDEAYRAYDQEAQTTWRGDNNMESAPDRQTDGMPTREAVEQAYAEYDRMMAEAWKKA